LLSSFGTWVKQDMTYAYAKQFERPMTI
jgi:hypothetical protein